MGSALTPALEDYLETIYSVLQQVPVVRVRDIANARRVRAASVTPAMQRLAGLGLIRYERREYISLTTNGEAAARRIFSRHQLLTRFFSEVLGMSEKHAEEDACAMEHSLSAEGMDRLTRFFEFLQTCPHADPIFLARMHGCPVFSASGVCDRRCGGKARALATVSLADIPAGESAQVERVDASGAIRRRLLDMGFLPGVEVRVERRALSGDPLWLRMHGFQVSLRKAEAAAVRVIQANGAPQTDGVSDKKAS